MKSLVKQRKAKKAKKRLMVTPINKVVIKLLDKP